MHGRDRGLQRERVRIAAERLGHERQCLGDLRSVPAAAILVLEEHEIARFVEPCVAARIVQQHECQEARHFRRRLGRHQGSHQTAQADGLGAEIGPH